MSDILFIIADKVHQKNICVSGYLADLLNIRRSCYDMTIMPFKGATVTLIIHYLYAIKSWANAPFTGIYNFSINLKHIKLHRRELNKLRIEK